MNKGVVITSLLLGAGAFFGISKLSAKKGAAEKLTLSLKKLQITKASFTEGILFKVFVSIVNPTPTPLSLTTPFIQIFIKNEKGESSPIANSENASAPLVIKPRETTELPIEIRLPLLQALMLPSLLGYLVSNFLDAKAKKTKKIIVSYSTKAEGMNISGKSEFLV